MGTRESLKYAVRDRNSASLVRPLGEENRGEVVAAFFRPDLSLTVLPLACRRVREWRGAK